MELFTSPPAVTYLKEQGEKTVRGIEKYANENIADEHAARGASLNLPKYLIKSRNEWK